MSKVAKALYIAYMCIAIAFLVKMLHYFITGLGGPIWHTVTVVPLCIALAALYPVARGEKLYSKLSYTANCVIALIIAGIGVGTSVYLTVNYESILLVRAVVPSLLDIFIALLLLFAVYEWLWRNNKVILFLAIGLLIYAVYGRYFPGALWHPGIPWLRALTSLTTEFETGLFSTLAQTGATTVAGVILITALATAFRVQDSIIRIILSLVRKRRYLVPETAVISSAMVAMVSGSGAANVAMTGQFTIPLMKRAGLAPHWAGATEVAASVAGIITPPVMGVAAFIMANILGVPYWEVAVRGFVIAAIYYIALFFSVALRGIRMIGKGKTAEDLILMKPNRFDVIKFILFFTIIGALIVVLGIYWWDPMTAAYMVVGIFAIPYAIVELLSYPHSTLKDRVKHLAECCKTFVEEYAREVSGLVLLLAGLSMIVGVFTITGWIIKMLGYIVAIGAQNLILVLIIAYFTGLILGMGLPPSGIYVLLSSLLFAALWRLGVNPWIAQFFFFYTSILGEFVPPVSVAGAVAARLAKSDYFKTVLSAAIYLSPLWAMSFIIYTRPELVTPTLAAVTSAIEVAIGFTGLAIAMQHPRISSSKAIDTVFRIAIGVLGVLLVFRNVFNIVGAPQYLLLATVTVLDAIALYIAFK
jgi:TRAP transporter 4TM/12TM fusion protein